MKGFLFQTPNLFHRLGRYFENFLTKAAQEFPFFFIVNFFKLNWLNF